MTPIETRLPELNDPGWEEWCSTLHLWTQLLGKIRLGLEPMMNHWWQVPLYVTARGLTTSPMRAGDRFFELHLDLLSSDLQVLSVDGESERLHLPNESTLASFYAHLFAALRRHGLDPEVKVHPRAVEIPQTIHLDSDTRLRPWNAEWGRRFFTALVHADRWLKDFRAPFTGKASPVQFFWGSFDHAVSRFSGRRAPKHPGGMPNCPDWVMHEAYADELSAAGFWPGGKSSPALFYSYAWPEPDGFAKQKVLPREARWDEDLGEFVLLWEDVRRSRNPDATVRAFLQSTWEAAANCGRWDRTALERPLDLQFHTENPHERHV